MVGCFLPSSLPQQHPPLACRKAACAFATIRGGVPIEVSTRLRLASVTSPSPWLPLLRPWRMDSKRLLRNTVGRTGPLRMRKRKRLVLSVNYGVSVGAGVCSNGGAKAEWLESDPWQVSGRSR